jgi:hypothetical protein
LGAFSPFGRLIAFESVFENYGSFSNLWLLFSTEKVTHLFSQTHFVTPLKLMRKIVPPASQNS